jgi:hypothetical protein
MNFLRDYGTQEGISMKLQYKSNLHEDIASMGYVSIFMRFSLSRVHNMPLPHPLLFILLP